MAYLDRFVSTPRDRRLVSIVGFVLAGMMVLGLPVGLEFLIASRRTTVDDLRQALSDVQDARGKLRDHQAKKDAVAARYVKKAPALAGFIEQAARKEKLEVTDSVDRPDTPIGKHFVERSTVVHLKKAGMYSIAKFLEGIERSGDAVAISRLSVRKRTGEPDSFDVEVGVSAYDRAEKPAATPDKDKDKTP
jgi:general secretion pathway protein M